METVPMRTSVFVTSVDMMEATVNYLFVILLGVITVLFVVDMVHVYLQTIVYAPLDLMDQIVALKETVAVLGLQTLLFVPQEVIARIIMFVPVLSVTVDLNVK
jgi:hypothetical protein